MIRAAPACAALLALAGCSTVPGNEPKVELTVAGPPIASSETAKPYLYAPPEIPEGMSGGGALEQHWSMLGREDMAAAQPDADEYLPSDCAASDPAIAGTDAVLDEIVRRARDTRVTIVNESHYVTRHRDFSRRLIERLRPLGYTVFAAETFMNVDGEPDPALVNRPLPYPHIESGHYSSEPVFGQLVRRAKELGYRFGVYEQVFDPATRNDPVDEQIARREEAQAAHLAAILAEMGEDEKLVVHVGYSHARESIFRNAEGVETAWMAARLRRMTGIDPLTVSQFDCRGGSEATMLSQSRDYYADWFDMSVDHPLDGFRFGRAAWRFDEAQAVAIPAALRPGSEPLVIEAFRAGEPFEAVPEDRVYVEPGEDVRLALRPGRYTVRAVRLAE